VQNKNPISFLAILAFCLLVGMAWSKPFQMALPGYHYHFPLDHAAHPEYKTEWWYYTGHLTGKNHRKYGYELTFFRSGIEKDPKDSVRTSKWAIQDVYLAHFAITDLDQKRFVFHEKLTRKGPGLSGALSDHYTVWNHQWRVEQLEENTFALQANMPGYRMNLLLSGQKPVVVHGQNGVSQKADCSGCASHYYSMTRLKTTGVLETSTGVEAVKGLSWMDHEFGSNQLASEQVGWDWFSVQLANNTELMLYRMRLKNGKADPNSSGTFIDAKGKAHPLKYPDFKIVALKTWKSPHTQAVYPSQWKLLIPSQKLELLITPQYADQELNTTSGLGGTYWEGTSQVTGMQASQAITGQAYVEMTGYAKAFSQKI
jgi:predicted secreted hydrolase